MNTLNIYNSTSYKSLDKERELTPRIFNFIYNRFPTNGTASYISRAELIHQFGRHSPTLNYIMHSALTRIETGRGRLSKYELGFETDGHTIKSRQSLYLINATFLKTMNGYRTAFKAKINNLGGIPQQITTLSQLAIKMATPLKHKLDVDGLSTLKRASNGRYLSYASTLNDNLRKSHLKGYTAIDAKSAHSNWLYQLYLQTGHMDLSSVEDYLHNSTQRRKDYAIEVRGTEMNIVPKDVKRFITGLFNGYKLINNDGTIKAYNRKSNTCRALGKGKYNRLSTCPSILDLYQEIAVMVTVLTHEHTSEYTMINAAGFESAVKISKNTGKKVKMSAGRILSHIANGIEVLTLEAAFALLKDKDTKFVPVHDGFYVNKEVDIATLEAHVYNKVGLTVSYTKEIV